MAQRFLFLLALLGVGAAAGTTQPEGIRQWRPMELAFTAKSAIADPFDLEDADFAAEFTGPGGRRIAVPGFWDGGNCWKIRFTPPLSGNWTYVTRFANPEDDGLHGQQGSFRAASPAGSLATHVHGGFLGVSADQRFLTHTDGTPFFWLGDTWWAAPSANVPFDVFQQQVEARVAQGFTVYQAHGHRPIFDGSPVGAFEAVRKPDGETLRYWRETDRYLAYADEKGLVGMLGFGRGDMFDALSLEELKRLWRYYLARYGAYSISFLITQEYNIDSPKRSSHLPKLLAVGRFIKEADPYRRAMTVHPWVRSRDDKQAWGEPWLDFIMLQAGHRRFESAKAYLELWERAPIKPFLESEANYEGFATPEFNVDDAAIRRSAYTAIQSGSFGFTYGAQGLYAGILDRNKPGPTARWGPVLTWKDGLALAGGRQLQHLRTCYETVAWWQLRPVPGAVEPATPNLLVKASPPNTYLIYFVATKKPPGELALTGVMPGASYRANWFDPRTGQSATIESRPATGDRWQLPVPPDNRDWMLIVRRQNAPDHP